MNRLMATHQVARLRQENRSRLICWVEGECGGDSRDLCLGEDHPDYTVRVGSYRVTSDGRVWVNADPTLLEERWVVVE